MMKPLSLVTLLLLAACVDVSGNDGTEMYDEVITDVETGRTASGR